MDNYNFALSDQPYCRCHCIRLPSGHPSPITKEWRERYDELDAEEFFNWYYFRHLRATVGLLDPAEESLLCYSQNQPIDIKSSESAIGGPEPIHNTDTVLGDEDDELIY